MILVPVKEMSTAKQRLASVLTQEQRTLLARTMLKDICAALAEVKPQPAIALVTNDAFATGLARHYGFQIIVDNDNLGESEAIAMATVEAEKRGAQFTMVLPGDIPLLRAHEVEAVLAAMPMQGSVLVPAAVTESAPARSNRPSSSSASATVSQIEPVHTPCAPIARAASPDGKEYEDGCATTVSGAGSAEGAFASASNGRGRRTTSLISSSIAHASIIPNTTVAVAAMPRRLTPRERRRRNARIHQKKPFQFR